MHILDTFMITKKLDNLLLPKSKFLLPIKQYEKILVIKDNYNYIGSLGKIENKFIIFNQDDLFKKDNKFIDCILLDDIDYRFLTEQIIISILTKHDLASKDIEQIDLNNKYILIAKITDELSKQLHIINSEDILLKLEFLLPYKTHFSEEGFLLRDNLNYLRDDKDIDFVYDFDMLIHPNTSFSFWYYNIFIDFENFVKLFEILYSVVLTIKKS